MASPQKENGFTAIANEILDHLALPGINGSEYRLAILVLRKTYGFAKKKDYISLTQFQKGTGMQRQNVVETLKSLVVKRLLLKEKSLYQFNKNWEEWVVAKRLPSDGIVRPKLNSRCAICKDNRVLEAHHIIPKNESGTNDFGNLINLCPTCHSLADRGEITREQLFRIKISSQKTTAASSQKHAKGSSQKTTHKRKTKETITKERNTTELRSGEIVLVIDKFEDTNPSFKKWYGNTTQRSAIGRMLETHGTERLMKVVALLPKIKGKPYFPTITTPLQLEDKWAALESAFIRYKGEKDIKKSNVAFT